jgi:hypothetical protein
LDGRVLAQVWQRIVVLVNGFVTSPGIPPIDRGLVKLTATVYQAMKKFSLAPQEEHLALEKFAAMTGV